MPVDHEPSFESEGSNRKSFRVLMVASTSFFSDYGCHVRILEEARTLQQLGNQVAICTYHNGRDVAGLDIRRTRPIPWRTDYEVGSSRHKLGFDMLLLLKTLSVAARLRPQIIHGHTHEGAFIGLPISRMTRTPLVLDFQGSMTAEMVDHHFLNPQGPFYRPARWLEQRIVEYPAAIITSSYHAHDLLGNDFHCPPGKITAVPDCVNASAFAPQPQPVRNQRKALLGIPADRRVVVYLGLLAEWQGTGLLLEAARILIARQPDVHFLIMGFPAVDTYSHRARQMDIAEHVTFTGKIAYEQAPEFLSVGDVAVAPKISATEGSGKLLNYMAMGLPTVAFDVPVSREYLGNLGIYAKPGSAQSLAAALESALQSSAKSGAIGSALRQRAVGGYSWTDAGLRLMAVYDRVISRATAGSPPRGR
jgi:glycosyltransferase involved in cell wall biosynthesis